MNTIRLRGHHIGHVAMYQERPYSYLKDIYGVFGKTSTRRLRDYISKITDDSEILLVNGLDNICGRCVYNEFCANEDYLGLGIMFQDKYAESFVKIPLVIDLISMVKRGFADPDYEDYTILKKLDLEVGIKYPWKELKERYFDHVPERKKSARKDIKNS